MTDDGNDDVSFELGGGSRDLTFTIADGQHSADFLLVGAR